MTAAKHTLRYLRGTTDLPIVYKRGQLWMVSYTDASFGANPDNRKSTTGYLFFLGGGLISFESKTQSSSIMQEEGDVSLRRVIVRARGFMEGPQMRFSILVPLVRGDFLHKQRSWAFVHNKVR